MLGSSLFNAAISMLVVFVISGLMAWGGYALGWFGVWLAIFFGTVIFPVAILAVAFFSMFATLDWSGLNND